MQDWLHGDTVDIKGKGHADGRTISSKAAAAEEAAKREAELRAMYVVVPPGDEAKPISCPICKEPLKSEFLEDDEEWVWRNALKKDDRVSRRPRSFVHMFADTRHLADIPRYVPCGGGCVEVEFGGPATE